MAVNIQWRKRRRGSQPNQRRKLASWRILLLASSMACPAGQLVYSMASAAGGSENLSSAIKLISKSISWPANES